MIMDLLSFILVGMFILLNLSFIIFVVYFIVVEFKELFERMDTYKESACLDSHPHIDKVNTDLISGDGWDIVEDSKKKVCCSHLRGLFEPDDRNKIVDYLFNYLIQRTNEFDAIIVSGYSMSLVAPIIAYKLDKNIVLVRKEDEDCHSSYLVEGVRDQRCIIIDDLIASGDTVRYCIKQAESYLDCKVVGIILYDTNECELSLLEEAEIDSSLIWKFKEIID